jgi:hypothetical protein
MQTKETTGLVTGKEETGMNTMNGRRIHALFQVWIVQS